MYLNKSKKGYGWYAMVKTKDLGGNELTHSINFSFKRGCEPKDNELNTYGAYEGEMYFVDVSGRKRKVFPIVHEYNGLKSIEFKVLDFETAGSKQSYQAKQTIEFSPEELPWDE